VKAKFGQDAIWPELDKAALFEQVMVQIRAGSTAKPNKMRERDQWLQFLPQLQEALGQIAQLREAGNDDMAEAMIKVLDETLRRFDERLSIKEFIPGMDGEEGAEGEVERRGTELQVKEIQFGAEQQVAAMQRAYDARNRKLDAREATADVVRKVTDLLDGHQQQAQQAINAGLQPADSTEVVDEVHAVLVPALDIIDPPEAMGFDPLA
jgi:hypothetical protein